MKANRILRLALTASLPLLFSVRLSAQEGTWSTLAGMPVANSEFSAATIGDRIFCVGGFAQDTQRQTLVYQPGTGTWRTAADVPHEIHHANVAVVAGKLYVFGGGHQASDHVQIYDPASNRWSEGRPMPTSRTAVATAVVGGRIHVIGGTLSITFGNALPAHEVYDPATDSWSSRAPLPFASEHVSAGVLGGRIVVVGGRHALVNLNATQIYDPATDRWSSGAPLPVPTSGMAVQVFRDRLYVFGGEKIPASEVVAAVQRYDPGADRWEVLGALPVPVHGVASAVHGNAIYLFGGSQRAASAAGVTAVQRYSFPPSSSGGKPARPTRLTARPAGPGAVRLEWRDNARNEIAYLVEVRPPGAPRFTVEATLPAGATSVTLSGLDRAGAYRFRVFARSSTHLSLPSNVVQVRVPRP
jgi:N-acetylneuraminic acid mutarotase